MNVKVLKQAEKRFLSEYPGGFKHPLMLELGKKHKMDQMIQWTHQVFAKRKFDDPEEVVADMARLISRSSMISMFEKPKFKRMVSSMGSKDKHTLVEGLYDLLHGKEKVGFELLVSLLRKEKMAKWTLSTAIQAYFRPQKDVFVKPTTTKLIIEKLELGIEYRAVPTWNFYRSYRNMIKDIRGQVSSALSPNNAAFCGFLMMSLGDLES